MSIEHVKEPAGNAIRQAYARLIGRGQSTYTPTEIVVKKAKGVYLWTVDGRKLIDFTSGVLVSNLGYAHPRFEERCKKYRKGLPRNAYNMLTELQAQATQRLLKTMASPRLQKALWAASGSEGVQKAMWTALHRYPSRNILVATRFGFHGKKGLAADVTGESSANPDVRFISFPMHEERPQAFFENELADLWTAHRDQIALLITEPYLGAAGSFHPPKWYHQLLQEWCHSHDIPFIFDEVQSCFGRTGHMFAYQTYEVEPDLVVLGKGLANGEPAAVVVGRADLIDALDYGEASDTFSGSTMACAAVCAALDVFEEEEVVKHVQKVSEHCRAGFRGLQREYPFIRAIRGEGLVFGVEIDTPQRANQCVLQAYYGTHKKGVHFLGPLAKKVLRVSPPLVITKKELDEAFEVLHTAWKLVG
ncbi:MAG: aspartate aminotransferase family protein [Candidatus Hydrogenedentes bacterium]|nr:aspartate aminotransferase family protein [Candidatus Hydrogenedentota bacterium]